ncbi:MAG TPA: phage holin family protein [Chloroflexota bacterium]|jgi:putative membrane protein|nr:phage holin family protein [Chloroflexota bacterium]
MANLFLRWLVPFIAILLAAQLMPRQISVPDLGTAAIFAFVLAVLNAVVRPVLSLLALPITCLTLGLFHFVLNAATFALAAALVPGVVVEGFPAAFLGALIVSAVGLAASWLLQ